MNSWSEISKIVGNESITIERIKIPSKDISIEGRFELPPLAKLSESEQVFIAHFVKSHGSIKEMEKRFGISYPTIKNRLNQISEKLGFLDISITKNKKTNSQEVLEKLEKGSISADEAIETLKNV